MKVSKQTNPRNIDEIHVVMTVLEAIEQLTAERKEKRIEPLNIVFLSIYDKLSISWFEMVEELERLKEAGLIHIGDTPKDRYAKLLKAR